MFHVLAYGRSPFSAYYDDLSHNSNTFAYFIILKTLLPATSYQVLNFPNSPTFQGTGIYEDTTVQGLTGVALQTQSGRKFLHVNDSGCSIELNFPWLQGEIVYAAGSLSAPIPKGKTTSGS